MKREYKEAYALIFDAHALTKEEHHALHEFLDHLSDMVNGHTPYTAYFDPKYSDNIIPKN